MSVNPIPEGYHTVCPYIIIDGAQEMIDFLVAAFDAEVRSKTLGPASPGGTRFVKHAEVRVGTSMIMISDGRGEVPANPVSLYCYVEDVDACHARALAAGGQEILPPTDMFYGDRHGGVVDPAGNSWYIASRVEDVAQDELQRRADAYHAKSKA